MKGKHMIDERIYQQFVEIGRDLYEHKMISSHGGNLSIRLGDRIIIKRRGAQLGRLKPHDLIETGIDKNDSGVAMCAATRGDSPTTANTTSSRPAS